MVITTCRIPNFHNLCLVLIHSSTWVRVSRYTLKHDSCSSITERAVDNIGVTCDPTNVSHTGKDVLLWVVVKGILE